MIGFFIIFSFIISSLVIFLFDYPFAIIGLILSLAILIIKKVPLNQILRQLKIIASFVIVVFILNLFFDNFINSVIIALKIISVCLLGFSISKLITKKSIADGIVIFLFPLKIFKVNLNKIRLMILISLNYLTILRTDFVELKHALISKGVAFDFKHAIKSYLILSKKYFETIFIRLNELELSFYAKGWID